MCGKLSLSPLSKSKTPQTSNMSKFSGKFSFFYVLVFSFLTDTGETIVDRLLLTLSSLLVHLFILPESTNITDLE